MPDTPSTTILSSQEIDVTARFADSYGRAVTTDGPPTWEVADTALIDLVVNPDGLSAVVKARGQVGITLVTVSGDVLIGDEERVVSGEFTVTVTEDAVTVHFTFGEARPRT